jgi:hypothetical protein
MEGVAESPVSLAFFDIDEAAEGPTFRRITLIEADGRRSVQVGGLPAYVYEADDKGAEAVCIALPATLEAQQLEPPDEVGSEEHDRHPVRVRLEVAERETAQAGLDSFSRSMWFSTWACARMVTSGSTGSPAWSV